tara:strand:- start:333 stop:857 length:525 start_codon:yes stop_codon:yes gene_type:complete
MKEQNYYEVKGNGYNYYPVKLIKLTEKDFITKSLPEKKQISLSRKFYNLSEISITQSHLNRLGFSNQKEISTVNGINLFPIYMVLGEDNLHLRLIDFGYKILKNKDFSIFKSQYLQKYNDLKSIKDEEYDQKYIEIKKNIKSDLGLISNVNELFEELETVNFSIENKDIIVSGK